MSRNYKKYTVKEVLKALEDYDDGLLLSFCTDCSVQDCFVWCLCDILSCVYVLCRYAWLPDNKQSGPDLGERSKLESPNSHRRVPGRLWFQEP